MFLEKLADLSASSEYYDYIYYDPITKTYRDKQKEMTKAEFIKSNYDYGIGAYIHLDDDLDDETIEIAHYELVKRDPFFEYNPGINDYQLKKIYPLKKYKRP